MYCFRARFIRALSERSALRGITFLFLIIYKYLADASFIFVSCTYLDPRLVGKILYSAILKDNYDV